MSIRSATSNVTCNHCGSRIVPHYRCSYQGEPNSVRLSLAEIEAALTDEVLHVAVWEVTWHWTATEPSKLAEIRQTILAALRHAQEPQT